MDYVVLVVLHHQAQFLCRMSAADGDAANVTAINGQTAMRRRQCLVLEEYIEGNMSVYNLC